MFPVLVLLFKLFVFLEVKTLLLYVVRVLMKILMKIRLVEIKTKVIIC